MSSVLTRPLVLSSPGRAVATTTLLLLRNSRIRPRTAGRQPAAFVSGAASYFSTAPSSSAVVVDATTKEEPLQQQQHPHQQVRRHRPIYVAATRQHVGKTSVSLAMLSGLQHHLGGANRVGFMKPVGQECVQVSEPKGRYSDMDLKNNPSIASRVSQDPNDKDHILVKADKDAALFLNHFGLQDQQRALDASPVVIPPGYTRDYVDGKITSDDQKQRIHYAYQRLLSNPETEVVLCEGTGHVAVGSIVEANNAQVASWLGASMVLVANGGLGKAFDELELNKVFCDKNNVPIAGVIINKVIPEKYDQTKYYMEKVLQERWGVPLLGCIPDRPFLGCANLADFERLFKGSSMVSGHEFKSRHFKSDDIDLVTTSLNVFLKTIRHNDSRTLYVCHASRNDILLAFLMEYIRRRTDPLHPTEWEAAMIVTGCAEHPISSQVLEIVTGTLQDAPPVLLATQPTKVVMEALNSYTPKLNSNDRHRVEQTIQHYESKIDFQLLLERSGYLNDGEDNLVASLP